MTGKTEMLGGKEKPTGKRRYWLMLPFVLFFALACVFFYALSGNPALVPSVLIGKPVPAAQFAPLEGLNLNGQPVAGFDEKDLAKGGVTVVNFWASWCGPCVVEHPQLIALGKEPGIQMFGVNYKDQPGNARRFLGRYGNPYTVVGTDMKGRGAIEWGVYGMPETFVINGKGEIIYKHVGPISAEDLRNKILPIIKQIKAAAQAS